MRLCKGENSLPHLDRRTDIQIRGKWVHVKAKASSLCAELTSSNCPLGSPICDYYHVEFTSSGRCVMCVTDGCNWGDKPRNVSSS